MRRLQVLLLVLLLGAAWPASGQAPVDEAGLAKLEARVAAQPGRLDLRFEYARALSWAERWEPALVQYDRLLAAAPDNPDYLLGKAQVLAWSDRPAEALPILERARGLAPEYAAIARLEEQVRTRLEAAARPVQWVEAGLGWENLSEGLPDWNSQYLSYLRRAPDGEALAAGLRRTDRFDAADVEAMGGWSRPWGDDWTVSLEGSLAPGADVLPRWAGRVRAVRVLPAGWAAHGSLYQAGYSADDVTTATFGAERYVGRWYGGLTVYASRLQGADTTWSGQLRADRYYAADSRIGVVVATGRESASVGGGRFITTSTRSLSLLGQHRLAPRWSITWEVLAHEQGDAYTRRGLHAGLRHDF